MYSQQIDQMYFKQENKSHFTTLRRAAQMKKILPKVKLFMFVTDPIQRIYSHFNMCIRNKYPM